MPSFTDEEWEEISQEIPHKDEPFIQKFLDGRQALIGQEGKDRSDYHFRQSMTPIARRACAIVAKIRGEEKQTIRSCSAPSELEKETRSWRIIRRVPKGAMLHARLETFIDPNFLLGALLEEIDLHIWCNESHLEPDVTEPQAEFSIGFKGDKYEFSDKHLIWSEDHYVPGTPVPLYECFGDWPGMGMELYDWFRPYCAFSQHSPGAEQLGAAEILKKHHDSLNFMGKLILYEPVLRKVLRHLMSELSADGIKWAELRFTFPLTYCRAGSETPEPDHEHLFNVIDSEINTFNASPKGNGFWGLRFIWASIREWESRAIIQDMDNCLTAKLSHPHLIAGYDIIGTGHTLSELLPELFWFRKQCAAEGVTLPFLLTCTGEADLDAADALLLGARRLGPTPALPQHPALVAAARDKRVLVETAAPGGDGDALPALVARGVACALSPEVDHSSEDRQSTAFWAALHSWDELGLAGLGSLAENSVRWAMFEDQSNEAWAADVKAASLGGRVKAEKLKEWGVEWEKFCLWIVDEFGQSGIEDEEEPREEPGVRDGGGAKG